MDGGTRFRRPCLGVPVSFPGFAAEGIPQCHLRGPCGDDSDKLEVGPGSFIGADPGLSRAGGMGLPPPRISCPILLGPAASADHGMALGTSPDKPIFAFAALWDRSIKADGTAVESVVHITLPANDLMKEIHNAGSNPHRMPAILAREDRNLWLSGSIDEARGVLKPYPASLMDAYEVSSAVNAPKNNAPSNIAAVTVP